MNDLKIFNADVIPVYETIEGKKVVIGRELHEKLGINTAYKDWFPRMCEYGFNEETDYCSFLSNRSDGLAGKPKTDHIISLDDELNFIEKNLKGSTNYLKRAKSFLLIYHLLYKNIADLQEEVNALEEASI